MKLILISGFGILSALLVNMCTAEGEVTTLQKMISMAKQKQGEESASFVEKILQLEREGKNQNVDARDKFANAIFAAKDAQHSSDKKVETLQKILQQQGSYGRAQKPIRFPDESSAKELFIRSDASEGSIPLSLNPESESRISNLHYHILSSDQEPLITGPGSLQGHNLGHGQFQGPNLGQGQFQGFNLGQGQFQGLNLGQGQFQGPNPGQGQFQGPNQGPGQFQGLDQAPGLFQGPNSGPHQGLNGNSQNQGFIPNPSFGLDPTLGLNSEIGLNPNQGFNYENGLNPNQGFNFGNRVEPNPVYDTEFFSYDELNVESGSKPIRQTGETGRSITSEDRGIIRLSQGSRLIVSPGEDYTIQFELEVRGVGGEYRLGVVDRGLGVVDQVQPTLGRSGSTSNKTRAVSGDTTAENKENGFEEPTWIRGRMIFPGETSFLEKVEPNIVELKPHETKTFAIFISVPVNAREGYRHTLSISAVPSPPAVQGIQLLNPLSPPPTPSIPSLPFPSFPPVEKQLNPGPEFPSRPSFDPPSRIIELEVDLLVSSQSPELSDLSPPTCRVEKDNWASVCKPEPTRCQDRIWEVRLILQDAESGLVWLDLSDSGVFWERMNWRLGSLEPGWLEWKGSCCTSFLGVSSKNIGGLEGSCSAGDQEKYLQSLQSVSWTVLVVIIVFLVISLLIATVIIFYIRRKRKAQLEEMRQFPQPR